MSKSNHKLGAGFAIVLALSLSVVGLSYLTTARLIEASRQVVHVNGAIEDLGGTLAALENLEHSRLAWLVAGRGMHDLRLRRARERNCGFCHRSRPATGPIDAERFRKTHLAMMTELTRHVRELPKLISRDPDQLERLASLEPLINRKVALASEEIDPQTSAEFGQLHAAVLDQEVHLTDEIRKIIITMERTENTLLAQQLQEREAVAHNHILAVSLLAVLAIGVVVLSYLVLQRDLARRRALENQLQAAMRMEAIGRLAGGVAHDFNNLLTPILGYADLLRNSLGDSHAQMEHVNEITKAGSTAASVTRQLLAFSRSQTLHGQKLNLNAVTRNISKLLERLIGDQYQLEISLAPELRWIEADPSQIEQVIMNLVLNARDAMPKGGTIILETANVNLNGEKRCWSGAPLSGYFVMLAVRDSGSGMDEHTRSRIFEPFFTTKEQGKGTGLGLATVYGIVTQSNGRVCVQSAVGQGTIFEIYLPQVAAPAERTPSRLAERSTSGGHATILLVEDDEAVRRLVRHILVKGGYELLEAGDGEEALQLVQSFPGSIDLLITDVVMPRLNGLELRRRLVALRPGVRTIFVSGHAAGNSDLQSILVEENAFLAKPFTGNELLDKIGHLLERAGRTQPQAGNASETHAALH